MRGGVAREVAKALWEKRVVAQVLQMRMERVVVGGFSLEGLRDVVIEEGLWCGGRWVVVVESESVVTSKVCSVEHPVRTSPHTIRPHIRQWCFRCVKA